MFFSANNVIAASTQLKASNAQSAYNALVALVNTQATSNAQKKVTALTSAVLNNAVLVFNYISSLQQRNTLYINNNNVYTQQHVLVAQITVNVNNSLTLVRIKNNNKRTNLSTNIAFTQLIQLVNALNKAYTVLK